MLGLPNSSTEGCPLRGVVVDALVDAAVDASAGVAGVAGGLARPGLVGFGAIAVVIAVDS